ncbi:hypothetical protein TSUD_29710 [Trifolium subterraneum]|uniref:Uncharacterized protein n=1 Tax=Trifolium subterraneum TaxID=3900 RepID=A0A2Z6N7F6_TRISU|nr:hypothetical protein TSUD_29710 [Trifolium subterraneum]
MLERLFNNPEECKVGKAEILSRNCGIPIIEYGVSMKMNGIENVGLARRASQNMGNEEMNIEE